MKTPFIKLVPSLLPFMALAQLLPAESNWPRCYRYGEKSCIQDIDRNGSPEMEPDHAPR